MTKQQISNLFSWLPPGNQPHPNSGHSVLFLIENYFMMEEVCFTLAEFNVRFTCEQAEGMQQQVCYEIEAQTED